MRKVSPKAALVIALVVLVVCVMRWKGRGGGRVPARALAELAPGTAETYVEVADWERTLERWKGTELCAITQQPEWAEVKWEEQLERLKFEFLRDPKYTPVLGLLQHFKKVALGRGFVAWAGRDEARNRIAPRAGPAVLVGMTYRGKKKEVEDAMRALKETFLNEQPGAKSELSRQDGVEIETLTGTIKPQVDLFGNPFVGLRWFNDGEIHIAFCDDWLFLATDRGLLGDALDRYTHKPGAAKSLAEMPGYQACLVHAVAEPDFGVWAVWGNGSAVWETGGQDILATFVSWPIPENGWEKEAVEAVQFTARVDGAMHLYLHTASAPAAPLSNRLVALAGPEARSVAVLQLDALRGQADWLLEPSWAREAEEGRVTARSGGGRSAQSGSTEVFRRASLQKAFGPELCVAFFDEEEGVWQNYVVAVEVQDASKARELAEARVGKMSDAKVVEDGETTCWNWTASPAAGLFQPPMVLTKTHLFFGPSRKAVIGMVARAKTGEKAGENPVIAAAMGQKGGLPNGAFVYLDTKALIQQALWQEPSGSERAVYSGKRLFGPFEKHLRSGTIRVSTAGEGWLVETDLDLLGVSFVNQVVRGWR